jgi:hypothetical protein
MTTSSGFKGEVLEPAQADKQATTGDGKGQTLLNHPCQQSTTKREMPLCSADVVHFSDLPAV